MPPAGHLVVAWRAGSEALVELEHLEAVGRYVPNLLNIFQRSMEYEGPTEEDPAVLSAISAPMLLLHGSDTNP